MAEPEIALEVGGVYHDAGTEEAPAVDFIVGRIEDEPTTEGEPVLWVAHLQIGPAGGGDGVILGHAPVALEAATRAAIERVGDSETSEPFAEGYQAWREAYDAGEAGVFDLSPAEIYAAVQGMAEEMIAAHSGGAAGADDD